MSGYMAAQSILEGRKNSDIFATFAHCLITVHGRCARGMACGRKAR
tara:strand:+ start:187 stop:324 length:138 start_codon:yes stop_codon:yes gene_type:complete